MNIEKQLKIDVESPAIDPQLLFNRLLAAGQALDHDISLESLLSYELCVNPPSLFDENGLMRSAVKAQLSDAIAQMCNVDVGSSNADYLIEYKVFDDGSLLHRLPWCPIPTYSTITYLYSNFLKKIDNPIVVFDGYSGPSVKDATHIRHQCQVVRKLQSARIIFSERVRTDL